MIHPIGIAALILCCYVIAFLPKNNVVPALAVLIFVIPSAQRLLILSLDFSFLRIAILVALSRAVIKGESSQFKTTRPDLILLIWMIWGIIAYTILYGSFQAFVTRTGYMIEAVGAYFVGRIYIKSWDDMRRSAIFIGYAAIPILTIFIIERSTGKNMFSVFGGIAEYTLVREGRLRCQGPFSHPIMAGLFWAAMLPWFAALWFRNDTRRKSIALFLIATLFIILNTASSTPVMAIILCIIGVLFFRYRKLLPAVRFLLFFFLVAAQILMEKGAAHLIARANVVGGSTGWHRYYLIDESIKHFDEWWMIGTWSTRHWGLGLQDVTNQYILEGVRGGFLGMTLFVLFLFSLFHRIGLALRGCESKNEAWIYWSAGVVLFIHLFSFLSAAYFGQMVASFFIFCGAISSITADEGILLNKKLRHQHNSI